jgi:2-phosphosulfolactate phosphatase
VRVDVALTADRAAEAPIRTATVLVVDVLRASTTIITALGNGCRAVVPVGDAEEARRRRAAYAEGAALIAGERRGEPLAGFDLGNSPLEFTAERVRGRTIVLTTSNGTRALLAAMEAPAAAVAGLVNLTAAAAWARGTGRDVTILCAGERGAVSLEDHVCAGLLVARLVDGDAGAALSAAARAARDLASGYAGDIRRLGVDSPWARHLESRGRGADVDACLTVDVTTLVPRLRPGVDKLVTGSG